MTSYLSKNEAENLQNGDVHLAQIADFGMRYLENQFATLRSVMAHLFEFFYVLSLELNFFSTRVSF